MKAYEKFEARLHELGLYDEWCQQGSIGRVGTETEAGIFILVQEEEEDTCSEYIYPPMSELEKNKDFRELALDEFWCHSDDEFVGKLCRWYKDPRYDCPLFPVDVYSCYDTQLYVDFKDDVEEQEVESKQNNPFHNDDNTTEEWCPHCDTCIDLEHEFKVQKCPNCGKWIVPCSICPLENCSKHCPLERLAFMLNGDE
jgi:predicted RNA-binding Zn-ribbon protein involved in translation (DUF1610 family)